MIHDATHCSDYNKKICPKECYKGRLVEDLNQHKMFDPSCLSWAYFRETDACPLHEAESDIFQKIQDLKEGNRAAYRKEQKID